MPRWNEPGCIDAHLRDHLPALKGPADKVVADVLARLVATGRALMEEPDADVVAQVMYSSVVKLARLLVGLRPEASSA